MTKENIGSEYGIKEIITRIYTKNGVGVSDYCNEEIEKEINKHYIKRTEVGEILEVLYQKTDDDPCRLDHHGYCQTHGWFDEGECSNARALKLIEQYKLKVKDSKENTDE